MALQRIRLQSVVPLPSFRVWFLVPQDAVNVQSLKTAISEKLPALKRLGIRPAQLILELDGFELLDECSIELVHEGDIILVNARESDVLDKLTHKPSVENAIRAPKRLKLSVCNKGCSRESSSSALDSSTSDSSTSSSSDSDSEDSKSIPGDNMLSSNKKSQSNDILPGARGQTTSRVGTSGIQQPTVPPGLGKASTHSRNKRRKLKRKCLAAQFSSRNENVIHQVWDEVEFGGNDDILCSVMEPSKQQPLTASVFIIPPSPSQCQMSNGFIEAERDAAQQVLDSNSSSVPTVPRHRTTFIPPSEREDLPNNMFVTSVEFNWQRKQERTSPQVLNKVEPWASPDHTHAVQLGNPNTQPLDWATIEKAWEKYNTVNASMKLLPGAIVAWKAFGLDPVTLTPQASMLHLGQVVMVNAGNVLLQPLTRPNVGCATFGRTSVDQDQEPVDQISHTLQEVWSNEWKLISHQ